MTQLAPPCDTACNPFRGGDAPSSASPDRQIEPASPFQSPEHSEDLLRASILRVNRTRYLRTIRKALELWRASGLRTIRRTLSDTARRVQRPAEATTE